MDDYWRHHPTSAPSQTIPTCPRCGCVLNSVRFDFVDRVVETGCGCPRSEEDS